MLAKHILPKDEILLDFGHECSENWQYAKVERIGKSTGLFDNLPRVSITARYGDEIITADFKPDDDVKKLPRPVYFEIEVYIYSDSSGEIWEYISTDGRTKSIMHTKKAKRFPSEKAALKYAENNKLNRFRVIELTPPELLDNNDGRTWGTKIVWPKEIKSEPWEEKELRANAFLGINSSF